MLNLSTPQFQQILAVTAILLGAIEERQLTNNPYCTAHLVYDSVTLPFDPLLRSLQLVGDLPVVLSAFSDIPAQLITGQQHDESNLYIFLFTNDTSFERIAEIKSRLATPSLKIVLLFDTSRPFDAIIERASPDLDALKRYILIRLDGAAFMHSPHAGRLEFAANLSDVAAAWALQESLREDPEWTLEHRVLRAFVAYRTYYCMIVPIANAPGSLELIGFDVMMTHAVARQLRRNAVLYTDALLVDPEFEHGRYERISAITPNNIDFLRINRKMMNLDPTFVFDFNVSTQKADIYFNSATLHPDRNEHFVYLYPHLYDCLAVLVPIAKHRITFTQILRQRPSILLMFIVVLLLALLRAARRSQPMGDAMLLTSGAVLAQLHLPAPQRASDYVWTVCVLIVALCAVIFLSSIIFVIMVHVRYVPEIDTLEQLSTSDLVVMDKKVRKPFQNYPMLQQQIRVYDPHEFRRQLFSLRNTSNAYIVSESRATMFLYLTNFDEPRFRLMTQPIKCSLSSYRVPRASPIRVAADLAVQRLLEAGLQAMYVEWSMNYVLSLYWNEQNSSPPGRYKPLDWLRFEGVFYLYVLGMAGCLLVFGMEHWFYKPTE